MIVLAGLLIAQEQEMIYTFLLLILHRLWEKNGINGINVLYYGTKCLIK